MITSYLRTVVLYIILIAVVRFMGKRQIGQMEPSEFVVAMLIADLIAIPMQNSGIALYYGIIPVLTVLGLELLLSGLSMKSLRFRRLLYSVTIWDSPQALPRKCCRHSLQESWPAASALWRWRCG